MLRLPNIEEAQVSAQSVQLERIYRHDIITLYNEIRGRISMLQSLRDLYLSVLDSIDPPA